MARMLAVPGGCPIEKTVGSQGGQAVESAKLGADTHERGLMLTRIAVVGLLIAVTFLTLELFLRSIGWAAIVAFVTFGLYRRLRDWTGWAHVTAAFLTFSMLLVIGVPLGIVLGVLSDQAMAILQSVQNWIAAGGKLPHWLYDVPFVQGAIDAVRNEPTLGLSKIAPTLAKYGQAISTEVVTLLGAIVGNLIAFFMTVVTLYVFYVNGEQIIGAGRRLMAYVFPSRPPEFVDHIGDVVRAVVFGIVGAAVLEGIAAGIGFALFGVPFAVLLGAVTMIVSFVPGGQFVVWGSAAAWLFLQGDTGYGIGMVLWGVLVISSLDNFARPVLIRWSGSADIPFLLILFGVLGGVAAFGLLGLLLGPVFLAVSFILIRDVIVPPKAPLPSETGTPGGSSGAGGP